ncbi:type IV toxin-antitoxin system AbiEi family antitoxin domain-containing protein [Brachybacterium sp. DNPG3]
MPSYVGYRRRVREIALDHYGYITTREAAEAGIPPGELPKLAARGGLRNVAYGLYRVEDMQPSPYDQFAEALLRAGDGSFLHGESVLALFGLADVNPRRIAVAVRRRTRSKLPPFISITQVDGDPRTTHYEGLAAQPVADALLECRGAIDADRLRAAAERARREGLLTTAEWQRVRRGLRA